jgi:hypothetical protein
MTIYDIIIRRDLRRALRFGPVLTPEALQQGLVEANIEAWAGDPCNRLAFRLQLKRPTHQQALNEIAWLVDQYAFCVETAIVSEVAGDAVKAAVIEAFGGASAELIVVLAAIAGKATHAVIGAEAEKIRRDYVACQEPQGCWSLTKLSRHEAQRAASVGSSR